MGFKRFRPLATSFTVLLVACLCTALLISMGIMVEFIIRMWGT